MADRLERLPPALRYTPLGKSLRPLLQPNRKAFNAFQAVRPNEVRQARV